MNYKNTNSIAHKYNYMLGDIFNFSEPKHQPIEQKQNLYYFKLFFLRKDI